MLEGGDQYRGWFRSSLITAASRSKARAPYRHVVKNGWVNDEQGRAMSKSRGTGIDAEDAMDTLGRRRAAALGRIGRVRRRRALRAERRRTGRPRLPQYPQPHPLHAFAISTTSPPRDVVAPRRDAAAGSVLRAASPTRSSRRSRRMYDAVRDSRCLPSHRRVRKRDVGVLFRCVKRSALLARRERSAAPQRAIARYSTCSSDFCTALAPVLSFTAEEAWQSIPRMLRAGRGERLRFVVSTPGIVKAGASAGRRRVVGTACASCGERRSEREPRAISRPQSGSKRAGDDYDAAGHTRRQPSRSTGRLATRSRGEPQATRPRSPRSNSRAAEGKKCERCWKYPRTRHRPRASRHLRRVRRRGYLPRAAMSARATLALDCGF